MNILLVEDDAKTAAFVVKGLKQEGFAVQHVRDGQEGRALALHGDYDVAIIDMLNLLPAYTLYCAASKPLPPNQPGWPSAISPLISCPVQLREVGEILRCNLASSRFLSI